MQRNLNNKPTTYLTDTHTHTLLPKFLSLLKMTLRNYSNVLYCLKERKKSHLGPIIVCTFSVQNVKPNVSAIMGQR